MDAASIPRLAEALGVTTDELLQVKAAANGDGLSDKVAETIDLALRAVGLAMGVAVVVLTMLGAVDMTTAVMMLGIGLAYLGISQFKE